MLTHSFSGNDPGSASPTGILHLKGALTIEVCHELRNILAEALAQTQTLVIDVNQVEAIDVTGMQLLCAAHRSALLHYKCLSLGAGRSAAFRTQTNDAGYHCTLSNTCVSTEGQICLWAAQEITGSWEAL